MTDARPLAALTSLTLALVLALGGLLPPAHLHAAGTEERSRATVHRHALATDAAATGRSAVIPHGDHHRARFLEAVYDRPVPAAPDLAAVAVAATVVAPSASRSGRVAVLQARRVHGPPGPSRPTRAPPSVAPSIHPID